MINVAHNRYNRRTNYLFRRIVFNFRNLGGIFFRRQRLYINTEFCANQGRSIKINILVDRNHFT